MIKVNRSVAAKWLVPIQLKNRYREAPRITIILPPINSRFQAMKRAPSSRSQGRLFGLFLMMPSIPPPYVSAPDTSEKIKTVVQTVKRP